MHSRSATHSARRFALVSLALGLLFSSGCGNRVEVTGRILFRDKSIPNAEVRFLSEADNNLVFDGLSNKEGRYVLDSKRHGGVPKGKYQVTVTWYVKKDGTLLKGEEGDAELKGTPAVKQYQRKLSVDVTGEGPLDLDVSKGAK